MLVFKDVVPVERALAADAFGSGDVMKICDALVAVAFHDQDWRWVQEQCLRFLENEDFQISGLAATCLGHLARIHGQLDKDRVINALKKKLDNSTPQLQGMSKMRLTISRCFWSDKQRSGR
jgi:hypothetical protein